jgi:ribosomal-protein-alanine N-acetyltransferase
MVITFKEAKPEPDLISRILHIEKKDFGKGALNEYVIVPLMRHGRVYIAVDEDDEAIACAYFLADFYDPKLCFLLSVAVLPEFKGYDIGISLLDYALSDLKDLGLTKGQLTVDPSNYNALSVYRERLGFSVTDSADEYGAGGMRLVMKKEL